MRLEVLRDVRGRLECDRVSGAFDSDVPAARRRAMFSDEIGGG